MARPSEKTPEKITKIEEAAALGCSVLEICFYADIAPDTYYRWLRDDQKLSDRIEALRQKPILQARKTIVDGLADPNNAKWFLERKVKEFASKQEVDLKAEVKQDLSDEQYDQLLKLAAKRNAGEGGGEAGTA